MESLLSGTGMTTVSAVAYAALASIVYLCLHLRGVYSYWARRNVPGPRPLPLLGQFYHILRHDRPTIFRRWAEQHGKCYGIYLGTAPRLMVCDAEVVRDIAIRDFENFMNHHQDPLLNKYQKKNLFLKRGHDWKKVRALMSPTFTSGKIKRMFYLLDVCANDLVQHVDEQLGSPAGDNTVNVKEAYQLYAMDAIMSCCYSVKLERAGSSNLANVATRDEFVRSALEPFNISLLRLVIASVLPVPLLRAIGFSSSSKASFESITNKAMKMLESRRRSTRKFDDFMQLLIDARLENELKLDENDRHENHHAAVTNESLVNDQQKLLEDLQNQTTTNPDSSEKYVLDELEVVMAAVVFLVTGLETTGNLLTSASYALAFHQDFQERLYQELAKIATRDERRKVYSFDYDSLTQCKYLDAVLSETLRLLGPVMFTDRHTERDYHIKKYDIHLPKGSVLFLGVAGVHRDPDYWPEPLKFDPERFMPHNRDKIVPGSYIPFGMGPRYCIAMRFSLTEAKLGLAKLLINYKLEPAADTSFPPKFSNLAPIMKIDKPLVKMIARVH